MLLISFKHDKLLYDIILQQLKRGNFMKDKYIQAIILGVLIGGAILLDDFVGPKDEQKMEKKVLITSGKMPEGLNIDDLTKELHYKIEKGEDISSFIEDVDGLENMDVEIKVEIKKD